MIGAPAESDRKAERTQARIDKIEQCRVFDREELGQPRFIVVPNGKPGLQAVYPLVRGKARRCKAQLVRGRSIFRIIYGEKVAACAGQRDIERARFCLRLARRRHDHLVARRQAQLDNPA